MKRMFYYTDALPFLGRGEDAINKLSRNLEIFHKSADKIELVWHPWSMTEEYLKLNNSEVTDKYLDILNKYRQDAWGKLDESSSLEAAKEVLLSCDAYYGDVSDLVYDAQKAKMPVMLQNIDI